MKAVLIPIKGPANAKTRLAGLLTAEERRRLAWAMFADVSRAIADTMKPDRVVIVTNYGPAAQHAHRLGWDTLLEESQTSESASVDRALRLLGERGFDVVMRLPADVPLVRAADVDALLTVKLAAPATLLVPSRDGTGTNAIIRTPPALFPSRFGPNSLALHKEEAARVGVECVIAPNPRLALDIDEPADLECFLAQGDGTETFRFLAEIHAAERLKQLRIADCGVRSGS
ncbi:MAG TPA: 2-phospho-L-lactate guanylyltransferase [Blastocatellia bacterium]|nr:2-phospho-L-lactate guanylyltransferase [Blastocatellia bacterium]